jgi:hypothetical protein
MGIQLINRFQENVVLTFSIVNSKNSWTVKIKF